MVNANAGQPPQPIHHPVGWKKGILRFAYTAPAGGPAKKRAGMENLLPLAETQMREAHPPSAICINVKRSGDGMWELRKRLGLTQGEFARRIRELAGTKTSYITIGGWEKGRTKLRDKKAVFAALAQIGGENGIELEFEGQAQIQSHIVIDARKPAGGIKSLRESLGISRAEFAQKLNEIAKTRYVVSSIFYWESGARRPESAKVFDAFSELGKRNGITVEIRNLGWVWRVVEQSGMHREDFCQKHGLDINLMPMWESGENVFTRREFAILSRLAAERGITPEGEIVDDDFGRKGVMAEPAVIMPFSFDALDLNLNLTPYDRDALGRMLHGLR